jgi:hypothetical protein
MTFYFILYPSTFILSFILGILDILLNFPLCSNLCVLCVSVVNNPLCPPFPSLFAVGPAALPGRA